MQFEAKSAFNHNIYRGLYPIKEVKQYYKRELFKGKHLYICLWDNCDFKTWKYSQHIARHIHLKHIGIKELKCEEPNCEKTFKRPESLVQHQKNHLCGFGIDSVKMKDPNNVCGVKTIKKYYFRELDNDYYVFGCKWNDCEFVTNNSGSIRRHVHNQHLCPHSANNSNSSAKHLNNCQNNVDNSCEVNQPLIEIIELDSQTLTPKSGSTLETQSSDNPFTISAKPIDVNTEIEGNVNRRSSGGLYSLKNYTDLYHKVNINDEIYFKCNCNRFTTKSQISLVRHIWSDIGRNEFDCEVMGCNARFDNEFSLYKHRKYEHNYDTNSVNSLSSNSTKAEELNQSNFGFTDSILDSNLNKSNQIIIVPKIDDSSHNNKNIVKTAKSSAGIYSLKNLRQHFKKKRINDQMIYECNCCPFTTKSSASLVRHIWVHEGINGFECDLCSAQFDNESSLYRHRKFDHNLRNYLNVSPLPIKPNYANNSKPNNNSSNNSIGLEKLNEETKSISSNESIGDETNSITHLKQIDIKNSYAFDRSDSDLYSVNDYNKYLKIVKLNDEVSYKCTLCHFSSRSHVLIIKHIWNHSEMSCFKCDITDCNKRFADQKELNKHKNLHTSHTSLTSDTNNVLVIDKSFEETDDSNDNKYQFVNGFSFESTLNIGSKRGENCKQEIDGLRDFEHCFKTVKSEDRVKYVCNCGQFTTTSHVSLLRHVSEYHQNIEQNNDLKKTSNCFEIKAFETTSPQNVEEKSNESENLIQLNVSNRESRRNLTFKKYKLLANSENGIESQDNNQIPEEDLYYSNLIVKIEDRGYFCQWAQCEFSDDCMESVVSHIRQTHSNQTLNDNEMNEESEDSQQMDTYNEQDFEALMGREYRDNKLIYKCKASNCLFETALNSTITEHIQQKHSLNEFSKANEPNLDLFLCSYNFCNTSFSTLENLTEHQKIHGKQTAESVDNREDQTLGKLSNRAEPTMNSYKAKVGIQSEENYYDIVWQKDGKCLHICKWNNCGYQSLVKGTIIRHIRKHTVSGNVINY